MQRFFFLGLDVGDFAGEMRAEHEQLLELLRRGAKVEAVACVRLQIERSRERIQRALVEGRIDVSAI
jgi:DNA-binding GntR family transcriptional regulator